MDPLLGLSESECILQAKNYTIAVANVNGSPPANLWNYCATGVCRYTYNNGTSGEYVSSHAGSHHTASTCQLGYSNAVDSNEYVVPANIDPPGLGSAGEQIAYPVYKVICVASTLSAVHTAKHSHAYCA